MPETSGAKGSEATAAKADGNRGIGSGPGIILVLAYGTLALAATGRSILQIVEYFDRAPLAYVLSAVAALVYIVATVALVTDRLADWDERDRAELARLLARLTDTLELAQVEAALRSGMGCTQIADHLGVSRQAVHKKYAKRVPPGLAPARRR